MTSRPWTVSRSNFSQPIKRRPEGLLFFCFAGEDPFKLEFIVPLLSPPQRGGGTAAAVGEERGFQKTMWVSAAKRVYLSRMIHTKKVILCGSPHPPSFGWSPFPAGEGKRTINPNLHLDQPYQFVITGDLRICSPALLGVGYPRVNRASVSSASSLCRPAGASAGLVTTVKVSSSL